MGVNFNDYQNYFTQLHSRMDTAMDIRNLTDYKILLGPDGQEMKNTSKIILSKPRVFGDAMVAMLNGDIMQPEISKVDEAVQNKLEQWYMDAFYRNDELLSEQGRESLRSHFNFHICYRGWIAAVPLIKYDRETKMYLITIEPMDTRWMMWRTGSRGMEWTLNWVRLNRLAAEEKYRRIDPTIGKLKTQHQNKEDVIMAVVWDEKNYNLFETQAGLVPSNGEPWFSKPHGLPGCPVKVEPCPIAPEMISSTNGLAFDLAQQGPDIYAAEMNNVKYMNEFASVWATLNRQQFETPLQLEGADQMDLSKATFHGWGVVLPTPEGINIKPIPTADFTNSAQNLFREVENDWQMGTLSPVNYGQAGDRQSALAIINLKGDNAKQLGPRRQAISTMFKKIAHQFRRQVVNGQFYITSISKDDECAIEELDKSIFKDKFRIEFKLDSIAPQENIANMQLYLNGKQGELEEEWLAREILHVPDPAGFVRKARLQKLAAIIPADAIAQSIIELAPGDKPLQEEINAMRIKIFKKYLKDLAAQQGISAPPGGGQQGSPSDVIGAAAQANSNKLASNEQAATGQQAVRNAQQVQQGGR